MEWQGLSHQDKRKTRTRVNKDRQEYHLVEGNWLFQKIPKVLFFLLMEVEAVDIALEIGMSEKYFMKKPI